MTPLMDLRYNILTYAVPTCLLPAAAKVMTESLHLEPYDPDFRSQSLETTYFDTAQFKLRRARHQGAKYLTLRIRCYSPACLPGRPRPYGAETYALSAKTEDQKFRGLLATGQAEDMLLDQTGTSLITQLPGDLVARLLELTGEQPIRPVVTVCANRYAVQDAVDRLTLDVDVKTDTGKCLPAGVLEFKSKTRGAEPPGALQALHLRPMKISKFLWATLWR